MMSMSRRLERIEALLGKHQTRVSGSVCPSICQLVSARILCFGAVTDVDGVNQVHIHPP